MNHCLLIVLLLCTVTAIHAQDCVEGYTYSDPFDGNVTSSLTGSWTFIRGRTTIWSGGVGSTHESLPCVFSSTGLPSEIKMSINGYNFVDGVATTLYCAGGYGMAIVVPDNTPVGVYPWKFVVGNADANITTCATIRVVDVPDVPRSPVDKSNLTVPSLAAWEAHMIQHGDQHCLDGDSCCYEGNAWYYDGVRVYHQIRDYTGNDSYLTCVEHQKSIYFTYVIASNYGNIHGYRVFPHGFAIEYVRTGNEDYMKCLVGLGDVSAFGNAAGDASPDASRETAYLLHTYNLLIKLGVNATEKREKAVQFAIGHIDQWFISKRPFLIQAFMVGLTCDALIEYWQDTQDKRIPWIVEIALTGLWDTFYNESMRTINYNTEIQQAEYNLNLLVAHELIWLWAYTGNNTWRDRGDILFDSGVNGAWLDRGKEFSQNYRSSFKFVKWRQDPDLISEVAGPITLPSPTSPIKTPSGTKATSLTTSVNASVFTIACVFGMLILLV